MANAERSLWRRVLDNLRGATMTAILCAIFFGLPVLTVIPLPLALFPWRPVQRLGAHISDQLIKLVGVLLRASFALTGLNRWQVHGLQGVREPDTCILISNHQSWIDPLILHALISGRLPPSRFLIKRELTFIPLFGQALLAVGMPPLRRYKAAQLAKDPSLIRHDRERLTKACQTFDLTSSTICIFPEGTRRTAAKHAQSRSKMRHLLNPHTGGISIILQHLPQVHSLYDCTLIYDREEFTLWDYLCGRVQQLQLHVRQIQIPVELRGENASKKAVRQWLHALWHEKDTLIASAQTARNTDTESATDSS